MYLLIIFIQATFDQRKPQKTLCTHNLSQPLLEMQKPKKEKEKRKALQFISTWKEKWICGFGFPTDIFKDVVCVCMDITEKSVLIWLFIEKYLLWLNLLAKLYSFCIKNPIGTSEGRLGFWYQGYNLVLLPMLLSMLVIAAVAVKTWKGGITV